MRARESRESHERRERAAAQCRVWNTDPAHQRMAGVARAAAFTPEYQAAAGIASQAKFSALWRAQQGIAPLDAAGAQRLQPMDIRGPLGRPLPPVLQVRIHRAWCAGYLYGVLCWLRDPEWAASLDARLDAEEQGWMQPTLLAVPMYEEDLDGLDGLDDPNGRPGWIREDADE